MRHSHQVFRRSTAEAVGTFFLVFVGPGAAMVNAHTSGAVTHAGVALAFAFVVCAMIHAFGHISGAHINPAVTIAFWSGRRFPPRNVLPYVGAQCVGGAAAAFALRAVMPDAARAAATLPTVSLSSAFLIEFLLSFVLMLVIMAVATDERVAPGFAGIAVGLTVGMDAMMGGPLTGASMNPARTLGPALAANLWFGHWLYWIAPIGAMVLAVRTYEFLRPAAPYERKEALGIGGPIDAT